MTQTKGTEIRRLENVGVALFLLFALVSPAAGQATDTLALADSLRNAHRYADSGQVLLAYLRAHPDHPRAELMLAEVLYWQGDFSAAARRFANVLRAEPDNEPARRQLGEIRAASAPWLESRAIASRDNQPLDRVSGEIAAGFFLTPLWSLRAAIAPQRAVSGDTSLEAVAVRAGVRGYLAAARTGVELSAGVAGWASSRVRADTRGAEFVATAQLEIGIAPKLKLVGTIDRSLYTATIASLVTPIAAMTPTLALRMDGRWLGQAALQRTTYPDDNGVSTAYAWLLAPVAVKSRLAMHAGYAFSFQDAAESRFTSAGRYEPYFTPEQELQHSVAASLVTWKSNGTRLQINGSYAVHGRRHAPQASLGTVTFGTQSFHPYELHAAATVPLASAIALTFDAARTRTSFYHYTHGGLRLSVRFARAAAS